MMGHEFMGGLGWDTLLKSRRVLILAEAGSGKTREMQAVAARLVSEGKASFFLPLELLQTDDVASVLAAEPESASRYETWLRDGEAEAWFLLDAVDELKLSHGKLDTALRRLAASIGIARPRARLILSSRPSDWQPVTDLETLNTRFPAVAAPEENQPEHDGDEFVESISSGRRRRRRTETRSETNAPEFRAVELLDLDRKQIERFAKAANVRDVRALVQEIDKHEAWLFASRPLDLDDLIGIWTTQGRLGTRLEQHEIAVRRGLEERPDRQDAHLSPERARDGARRLALTLALTGKRTIRAPERTFGQGHDASTLDAGRVLATWTDAEVASLLRRSLFDPATYGRVRFHHRTIQEFLAAERLRELRAKGMAERHLHRILFAERYAELVVIPSRRPIAAWLALWNDIVAREILNREPEVLILHADPQSLSLSARVNLVRRYVAAYGGGDWRNLQLPVTEVRRLAKPDLAPIIRECWATPHTNEEIDQLLLKLIWLGGVDACADLAHAVALEDNRSNILRILAIRALAACGRVSELREIADAMLAKRWPSSVVHHSVDDLFPTVLTVDELGELIKTTPEPTGTVDGFSWAVFQLVDDLDPKAPTSDALRSLLTQLIWEGRKIPISWHHPASDFTYLAGALTKLCLRQFDAGLTASLDWVRSCVIANRFRGDASLGSDELGSLKERIQSGQKSLRAAIFESEFAFAVDLDASDAAHQRFYLMHESLFQPDDTDWAWLVELLAEPSKGSRAAALDLLASYWWRRGQKPHELDELKRAIADDVELNSLLLRETTPRPPSPDFEQHEARMAAHRAEQETEQAEISKGWLEWKGQLLADPDDHFGETKSENTLYNLTRWLGFRDFHGSSIAQSNWRDVGVVLGTAVGDRFLSGMRSYWRDHDVPVRSRRAPEDQNGISPLMTMGLTGLLIEVAQNADWAHRLTTAEAERAAEWAMIELNGFPEWLASLAVVHPSAVKKAVAAELEFEAEHFDTDQHPHVLSAIEYAPDGVRRLAEADVRAFILGWPKDAMSHSANGNLSRLLSIMTQLERSDNSLTSEYERRFSENPRESVLWLEALAACDLPRAVETMQFALRALPDAERRESGVVWMGALFGRHSNSRVPVPLNANAELLLELTELAYEIVRREDDVHHEGMYSPDARDDAESARNRIITTLIELPGAESHTALLKLANHPLFAHIADRLRQQAHDRAAADSEPELQDVSDILAIDTRLETPPLNRDDLFETMLDRIDDIDFDLHNHDFDERPALRAITTEPAMQPVFARKIKDAARGAYIVSREEEVADRKETDIRLAATAFSGRAVIELKIGDNWSVTELTNAIGDQLLERYLRHPDCSAGCLLVTYAGRKAFKNPDDGSPMEFSAVIERLKTRARDLEREEKRRVKMDVVGIDLRDE